jgi:CRP/FNR family transcriptional regulator, cyclic AMP receptor protein
MSLSIAHSSAAGTSARDILTEEPARVRASIARASLFASLPLHAIEDLAQRVAIRRVRAHGVIASQDEPGESLFIIMTGRVKVVIFGENGREVTLSLLRPGDAFGEVPLFDREPRAGNCIALEPSTLMVLNRDDLMAHIASFPQTALNLLSAMAHRLRLADENIAQLALCDVHERLIRRLISLAREEGNEVPEGLLLRHRPTQQELANMIGSCRETISRAFNQLAREGLIIPRGRQLIVTHALIQKTKAARAA